MKKTIAARSRNVTRARRLRQGPLLTGPRTSSRSTAPIDPAADQPDPDITQAEALEQARRMVVRATPKITQEIIKQAKLGSYLHARMLFDFAGLTAAQPPESASVSPVLELFLKQMETPPAKPALS